MSRFILEADGGARGNPGIAGAGAVLIDADTGEVLEEISCALGVRTNNYAEYYGLIAGLRAAFARDAAATVEVRMDSKLVVEQMSGRWKIKHPDLRELAALARGLAAGREVTYTWVPREENRRADAAANRAMDDPARYAVNTDPRTLF